LRRDGTSPLCWRWLDWKPRATQAFPGDRQPAVTVPLLVPNNPARTRHVQRCFSLRWTRRANSLNADYRLPAKEIGPLLARLGSDGEMLWQVLRSFEDFIMLMRTWLRGSNTWVSLVRGNLLRNGQGTVEAQQDVPRNGARSREPERRQLWPIGSRMSGGANRSRRSRKETYR
jgi:hypothetical protein